MAKIVVIGKANIDFTKRVEKFPEKNDELSRDSSIPSYGGKGANQAIAASRSGSEVSFIGCVGEDIYSQGIIDNLEKNAVNAEGVKVIHGLKRPDYRVIYVRISDGEYIRTGRGYAINQLTPNVIQENIEKLDDADVIIIQLKMPKESIDFVGTYCKQYNKKLIVNPAPAEQDKLDVLQINQITYLTPNQSEARTLFPGLSNEEIVTRYPNVVITLGKDGVIYYDKGAVKRLAALNVKCIDSTGAGDTFTGAFTTAICDGKSLEEAVLFARTAAGLKVQKAGAQIGMPTKDEIIKNL